MSVQRRSMTVRQLDRIREAKRKAARRASQRARARARALRPNRMVPRVLVFGLNSETVRSKPAGAVRRKLF